MARQKPNATETAAPNYGDCSLALPPDWSRGSLASGQDFMRTTIGHENGIADLYLKHDPGKAHQFAWCDPKDTDRRDYLRSEKYEWVKGGGEDGPWLKNPDLWEWDSEGFAWHKGQRAMARPREIWLASEANKKQAEMVRRKRADDMDQTMIKLLGENALDEHGRPLKKASRG
jgi:hypothetical protein